MQVRLAVDRNTDLALFGGRCEVLIRYDVGFDDDGHIQAVDMACITMVGVSV
jgi:xanthine dehydrogenase molybdopterin-binding subunit B